MIQRTEHSGEWHLRQARAMQRFDALDADTRVLMRTFGPRLDAGQDGDPSFRHCRICNPDPPALKCSVCDTEFAEKWQYRLHLKINPETCQRWGERKAKAWAAKA